jgi:hypothetical protein
MREKKIKKNFDSLFWSFLDNVFIISASICGRQENGLQKSKP